AAGEAEEGRRDQQTRRGPERERKGAGPARGVGLDDEPRDLRAQREVEVRQREDEEHDEEHEERVEAGGVAAEEDVLEAEAPEPEEIGEEADDRREHERQEEEQQDDDRDERRQAVRRTARTAATAEPGQVHARPV